MRPVRVKFGGASSALVAAIVLLACAKGTDLGFFDDEGGVPADTGTTGDALVLPDPQDGGDGSVTPDDGAVVKPDGSGTCTKKVVINELRTGGSSANDEFVELFNPTSCAVPLAKWAIKYESAGGASGLAGYTFASGDTIAAGAYFVVGSTAFSGAKNATLMSGFAAADGQVGLVDDAAKLVDGVAYGTVTGGSYREGSAAPSPPSGKSIGRMPNGTDTGSNSSDFKALASSSPGASN